MLMLFFKHKLFIKNAIMHENISYLFEKQMITTNEIFTLITFKTLKFDCLMKNSTFYSKCIYYITLQMVVKFTCLQNVLWFFFVWNLMKNKKEKQLSRNSWSALKLNTLFIRPFCKTKNLLEFWYLKRFFAHKK